MDSKRRGLDVKQAVWGQRSYALVAGLCQVRAHLPFTLLSIADQTIKAKKFGRTSSRFNTVDVFRGILLVTTHWDSELLNLSSPVPVTFIIAVTR